MLYLMQLAIYSGVSTLSLPVMLIAILKDGLEHVMPGLANVQHIPVYMCWICISQFPNVLYSMVANTLILYESEIKKKKKNTLIALNVFWGSFV